MKRPHRPKSRPVSLSNERAERGHEPLWKMKSGTNPPRQAGGKMPLSEPSFRTHRHGWHHGGKLLPWFRKLKTITWGRVSLEEGPCRSVGSNIWSHGKSWQGSIKRWLQLLVFARTSGQGVVTGETAAARRASPARHPHLHTRQDAAVPAITDADATPLRLPARTG